MATATIPRNGNRTVTTPNVTFPKLMRTFTKLTAYVEDRLDPEGLETRLEMFAEEGRTFVVRKQGDFYVISPLRIGGKVGAPLLRFPKSLTKTFDDEFEHGAAWEMVRWSWDNVSRRRLSVTVERTAVRHGHPISYKYRGCRCSDCTWANAVAHLQYLHSRPPKPKRELKHGAACWKRGCYCDAYRKASRERQQAWRERRRREAARAARKLGLAAGAR